MGLVPECSRVQKRRTLCVRTRTKSATYEVTDGGGGGGVIVVIGAVVGVVAARCATCER